MCIRDRERGLEFYAVNSNYAEETLESDHYSRKLKADLFIDDRNLGAAQVRDALTLLEIPSVYLSNRDSVFAVSYTHLSRCHLPYRKPCRWKRYNDSGHIRCGHFSRCVCR